MVAWRKIGLGILIGWTVVVVGVVVGCGGAKDDTATSTSAPADTSKTPGLQDTVTITVDFNSATNRYEPTLSQHLKRNKALIRWFNNTDVALSFSFLDGKKPFQLSNFSGIPQITVPARSHTGWFLLKDGGDGHHEDYKYNGTPVLWGPPSDPVVGADD